MSSQAYFHGDDPTQAAPERIVVFFTDREVQDQQATEKEGRPIYRMRTYITKIAPGDKNNVIERPARPEDQQKYQQAWAVYQSKQTQQISGTPLEAWPLLNRAQVAEFKALNIFTVENLACLPDSFAQRIMGANELRRKAAIFLESARDSAALEHAKAREEALQNQIATMQAQIEALMAQQTAKRVGWPKGKPRGPRKQKGAVNGTHAAATDSDGH